jgi:hypothetical protein
MMRLMSGQFREIKPNGGLMRDLWGQQADSRTLLFVCLQKSSGNLVQRGPSRCGLLAQLSDLGRRRL